MHSEDRQQSEYFFGSTVSLQRVCMVRGWFYDFMAIPFYEAVD